jgi:8-oxo-dGTP diphosphatase
VNIVEVVAGVVEREDGKFLLTRRPEGKAYAGYWEFPGGKIEAGETPSMALSRELHEELGIEPEETYPWITRAYNYSHAHVRLNFIRVTSWKGVPAAREGQMLSWEEPGKPTVEPMLPANAPILKALELPLVYAITNAGEMGINAAIEQLQMALNNGLRLLQIREKNVALPELADFTKHAIALARKVGARVLINGDDELAQRTGADGIHLNAARLAAAKTRPASAWCGASCHNQAELAKATALGVDFVALGPIKPTPSHAGVTPLAWDGLRRLTRGYPLPIFALGGLTHSDLQRARDCGAHGIAMIRGAWRY